MVKRLPALVMLFGLVTLFIACSSNDSEHARERAKEAEQKSREETAKTETEVRRLGSEVKADAKTVYAKINQALGGGSGTNGAQSPEEKLNSAEQQIKAAGSRAAAKLDRAAVIARVKARLVADVGLATVANVNVESNGSVVTLTGTVPSQERKHEVEESAAVAEGVTKVVNRLNVQP